jgi:hypothetical protein
MVPPVAIRLRRDFKLILMLIRAHALLHQSSRRKDAENRLIAEIGDYAAVHQLVADLVAEGAEVSIKPELRETVIAAAELLASGKDEVRQSDIKKALKLDKSAVSRRVAAALEAGFLRNLEDRKGRPARLVLGDPLPAEIELLPSPERLHSCMVADGDKIASSWGPRDSDVCVFCRERARPSEPLLCASVDGATFYAHRSCLAREQPSTRVAV